MSQAEGDGGEQRGCLYGSGGHPRGSFLPAPGEPAVQTSGALGPQGRLHCVYQGRLPLTGWRSCPDRWDALDRWGILDRWDTLDKWGAGQASPHVTLSHFQPLEP